MSYTPAVGDRVVLDDEVMFGPLRILEVTRVCKNGRLFAKSTTEIDGKPGSVRVRVNIEDVHPEPEDWPAAQRDCIERHFA